MNFEGWRFLGRFPKDDPDGVGSWLLHHGKEAALLETPPGLTPSKVVKALSDIDCRLGPVLTSHDHEDHYNGRWRLNPVHRWQDKMIAVGGEPIWVIGAPKHSMTDVVVVFRGVAMTGDIELGTLDSVNDEVPLDVKRRSMRFLADFEGRRGYKVHTVISAHCNDLRTNVCWKELFEV